MKRMKRRGFLQILGLTAICPFVKPERRLGKIKRFRQLDTLPPAKTLSNDGTTVNIHGMTIDNLNQREREVTEMASDILSRLDLAVRAR